jgi:hypothetical protein
MGMIGEKLERETSGATVRFELASRVRHECWGELERETSGATVRFELVSKLRCEWWGKIGAGNERCDGSFRTRVQGSA